MVDSMQRSGIFAAPKLVIFPNLESTGRWPFDEFPLLDLPLLGTFRCPISAEPRRVLEVRAAPSDEALVLSGRALCAC